MKGPLSEPLKVPREWSRPQGHLPGRLQGSFRALIEFHFGEGVPDCCRYLTLEHCLLRIHDVIVVVIRICIRSSNTRVWKSSHSYGTLSFATGELSVKSVLSARYLPSITSLYFFTMPRHINASNLDAHAHAKCGQSGVRF